MSFGSCFYQSCRLPALSRRLPDVHGVRVDQERYQQAFDEYGAGLLMGNPYLDDVIGDRFRYDFGGAMGFKLLRDAFNLLGYAAVRPVNGPRDFLPHFAFA